MADGSSPRKPTTSTTEHSISHNPDGGKNAQTETTSKARRRLGRSSSKLWFNKSFDQTLSTDSSKINHTRTMRRQSSVTDFFQNMLTKSKSHLQDIFLSKKDKQSQKESASTKVGWKVAGVETGGENATLGGAEGGNTEDQDHDAQGWSQSMRNTNLHNSRRSSTEVGEKPMDMSAIGLVVGLQTTKPDQRERRLSENKKPASPLTSNITATSYNIFMVKNPGSSRSNSEKRESSRRNSLNNNKLPYFSMNSEGAESRSKMFVYALQRNSSSNLPYTNTGRRHTQEVMTLLSYESAQSECENRVPSSSSGPQDNLCSASTLHVIDNVNRVKRSLVKSNSDTFARMSTSPQLIAKASSDGNCFKKSSTSSLVPRPSSVSDAMISVTDYLFLGSVEAAYNEPLLCKYGISSLIDMTNVSPTLVPPTKKSDCPCACMTQTHFRSKLNIGVDDIEWENLEQYFEEINMFINGAKKKDGRVLIFSYMGQSRAPAAAIQHLMHHFKMPYREALNIVRSKRPQVKLNSGFVKILKRLESRLGFVTTNPLEEGSQKNMEKAEGSPPVQRGSVEHLSAPPVVRGAWLEC